MKKAFTMIELIFVIVVIGILAGVAVPKLFFTRDDAVISNARMQVAAVQSGISTYYNDAILTGKPKYPDKLEKGNDLLFDMVVRLGVKPAKSGKNGWSKSGDSYTFKNGGKTAVFKYDKANGNFNCDSGDLCAQLQ